MPTASTANNALSFELIRKWMEGQKSQPTAKFAKTYDKTAGAQALGLGDAPMASAVSTVSSADAGNQALGLGGGTLTELQQWAPSATAAATDTTWDELLAALGY